MKYHSKLTYQLSFWNVSRKVDYHAGGKWFIHGPKRCKENQLLSLKHPWCSSKSLTLYGGNQLFTSGTPSVIGKTCPCPDVIMVHGYLIGTGAIHYNDVIMGAMASQVTSLTILCSTVYSGADQSKHQSSASLAFVRGIHRWPVNSLYKGPVTWKMLPFDDVTIHAINPDECV